MTTLKMMLAGGVAAAALAIAAACGGGGSSNSTGPTGGCTPSTNTNTIVIQNNQVCPQTLTIAVGGQVTFINNDSRVHEMDSDPHPEHTDCPPLNQVDFLNPGQSRTSGNLTTARRCGFHDHSNPDNAAMRGTITIQ
jgi:plastocyanin